MGSSCSESHPHRQAQKRKTESCPRYLARSTVAVLTKASQTLTSESRMGSYTEGQLSDSPIDPDSHSSGETFTPAQRSYPFLQPSLKVTTECFNTPVQSSALRKACYVNVHPTQTARSNGGHSCRPHYEECFSSHFMTPLQLAMSARRRDAFEVESPRYLTEDAERR